MSDQPYLFIDDPLSANRYRVIVVHGIGFHRVGAGAKAIKDSIERKELPGNYCIEELNWVTKTDEFTDRSSFLGLLRVLAYMVRLSAFELSHPRQVRAYKTRSFCNELVYAFTFSALLFWIVLAFAGTSRILFGVPSINFSYAISVFLSAFLIPAVLSIVWLFPFNRQQVRSVLRYWCISAITVLMAPFLVLFFFLRFSVWPMLWIVVFPIFTMLAIGVFGLISGAPDPQGSIVSDGWIQRDETSPSESFNDFVSFMGLGLLAIAVTFILERLFGVFSRMRSAYSKLVDIISTVFKYLSDISLYLCHSKFKKELNAELHNSIVASKQEIPIIICAHSLGTVIAIDTLLSQNVSDRKIVLATGGSPLQRWLYGFIPNSYDHCRRNQAILEEKSGVHWFNIYRSADPVGGALQLKPGSDIDVSGDIHSGIWKLSAHSDYWSDQKIAMELSERVSQLQALGKL